MTDTEHPLETLVSNEDRSARLTASGLAVLFTSAFALWVGGLLIGSALFGQTKVLEPLPAPTVTIIERPANAELVENTPNGIRVRCAYDAIECVGNEPSK